MIFFFLHQSESEINDGGGYLSRPFRERSVFVIMEGLEHAV